MVKKQKKMEYYLSQWEWSYKVCSTSDNREYEIPPTAPSKLPALCSGNFSYSQDVMWNTQINGGGYEQ